MKNSPTLEGKHFSCSYFPRQRDGKLLVLCVLFTFHKRCIPPVGAFRRQLSSSIPIRHNSENPKTQMRVISYGNFQKKINN